MKKLVKVHHLVVEIMLYLIWPTVPIPYFFRRVRNIKQVREKYTYVFLNIMRLDDIISYIDVVLVFILALSSLSNMFLVL